MAKKSRKPSFKARPAKSVLAIDLGGTKILVAAVDRRGRILELARERVNLTEGYKGLVQQMVKLAKPIVKKFDLKRGAIAAAGPLDPVRGRLLNPTNLKSDREFWGVTPLARDVSKALKIPMRLENDAAAAALAESWIGEARRYKNSAIVTLGTGLGLGIIANGSLVRAGQHLHTEGGHIVLNYLEKEWQCGCGNYGCAEAYLSGVNFTKNLARLWSRPQLRGEELVAEARDGDRRAVEAFNEYGEKLSYFLYSQAMLFAPQIVVLSGGFSNASDLFLPRTEARLAELLKMHRVGIDMLPHLKISRFRDEAGLLGAACVALNG